MFLNSLQTERSATRAVKVVAEIQYTESIGAPDSGKKFILKRSGIGSTNKDATTRHADTGFAEQAELLVLNRRDLIGGRVPLHR